MTILPAADEAYEADVCLLLEGTYPYVSGGVSTWVHNLITSLSDLTFCGVVILPSIKQKWKKQYDTPPNLVGLERIYIHDYELSEKRRRLTRKSKSIKTLHRFHQNLKAGKSDSLDMILPVLYPMNKRSISSHEMIYSKHAWDLMMDLYDPEENDESFIDFFWTFRFCHLPLLRVLDYTPPRARVYHSVSTGYAGLLGAVAAKRTGRPFMITEHGIYTKERKIEIAQAEWIYQANREELAVQKDLGAFQRKWIAMFEGMSRMAYDVATEIITLYEGNRQVQLSEGCPEEKTVVVPNGINLVRFANLKADSANQSKRFRVGFVGRVVPIKDVKTFLRACKLVTLRNHEIEFLIIGPTDEDERYYEECLSMTQTLGLVEKVRYTGKQDIYKVYPHLDLVVLTSISEAQPLVILEANCAGIPVVATDVGACSELLNGRTFEDKALGPSGLVTRVADPSSTANAMLSIIKQPNLRAKMIEAGKQRVSRYYDENDLNKQYHQIYTGHIQAGGTPWPE